MPELSPPRVQFVIGGVQKGGTTALAHYLGQHPQVLLPTGKEAHVFDAPDFDDGWDRTQIDQRYAPHYPQDVAGRLVGDATPIYCLHERFVQRIARYNPQMRWLIMLRDPIERAISQYHMERSRGDEHWPLLPALLLERWRLRGHRDDFSVDSPLRHYSYRLRGDYARQLDTLYRHFDRSQILVLHSNDLRDAPQLLMERVYAWLGLAGPVRLPEQSVIFAGQYTPPSRLSLTWLLSCWLLRKQVRELRLRSGDVVD